MHAAQAMPSTARWSRAVPSSARWTKCVRSRTSLIRPALFENNAGLRQEQALGAAPGLQDEVPLAGRDVRGLTSIEPGPLLGERDQAVGALVGRARQHGGE